jgi:hypothetical protein
MNALQSEGNAYSTITKRRMPADFRTRQEKVSVKMIIHGD